MLRFVRISIRLDDRLLRDLNANKTAGGGSWPGLGGLLEELFIIPAIQLAQDISRTSQTEDIDRTR